MHHHDHHMFKTVQNLPFPPILQVFGFFSYFTLLYNFGLFCRRHGCFSSLLRFDALNLVFDTFFTESALQDESEVKASTWSTFWSRNYMHNYQDGRLWQIVCLQFFDSLHFDEFFNSLFFQKELSQIIFVFSGLVSSALEISTLVLKRWKDKWESRVRSVLQKRKL